VSDAPVSTNDAHTPNENVAPAVAAPGALGNATGVDGDSLRDLLGVRKEQGEWNVVCAGNPKRLHRFGIA
jgi:hypothetical protein